MEAQFRHLAPLLYHLEREFPARISINHYDNGNYDFSADTTNILIESQIDIKAVALPLSIRREYFKNLPATNEKYTKPFLVAKKRLNFEPKPGNIVIYLNKPYNVKEIVTVENYYYYLDCVSVEGEYNG